MRQLAYCLFFAAAVVVLSTCGFLDPSGQVFADDLPKKVPADAPAKDAEKPAVKKAEKVPAKSADKPAVKKAQKAAPAKAVRVVAKDDAVIQQFEQQYGPQLKQMYKSELHFMRTVAQPTKQQYEQIAKDGEATLKATTVKLAELMNRQMRGMAIVQSSDQPDPRAAIASGLTESARKALTPEQAAKYQKELDARAEARKRAVVLGLVAKIDKVLFLTAEQRDKLGEVLKKNWDNSWHQTQWLQTGWNYYPAMPDTKITPLLTESQKRVWRGLQKGNMFFGFNPNFGMGIEIDDDPFGDDGQPAENNEPAANKKAVEEKEVKKAVRKK